MASERLTHAVELVGAVDWVPSFSASVEHVPNPLRDVISFALPTKRRTERVLLAALGTIRVTSVTAVPSLVTLEEQLA